MFHFLILGKSKKAFKQIENLLYGIQEDRERKKGNENTIVNEDLLSCYYASQNLSNQPIEKISGGVCSMIYAASLSSRTTSVHLLHFLLRNKNHLKLVMDEINQLLQNNNGIYSYEEMRHQIYLEKCILETLRLQTSFLAARIVIQSFERNGYFIPKGSKVGMSPYLAQ